MHCSLWLLLTKQWIIDHINLLKLQRYQPSDTFCIISITCWASPHSTANNLIVPSQQPSISDGLCRHCLITLPWREVAACGRQ